MSATTITMQRRAADDLSAVAETLYRELDRSAEIICFTSRGAADSQAILISGEKFFFRNGSYASLSVMLTEFDGVQTADIVGSGGGEGLFNISLFANSDFADKARQILQSCGFSAVEEND